MFYQTGRLIKLKANRKRWLYLNARLIFWFHVLYFHLNFCDRKREERTLVWWLGRVVSFGVSCGLSQQKLKIFVGQEPQKILVVKTGKQFVHEHSKQNWQKPQCMFWFVSKGIRIQMWYYISVYCWLKHTLGYHIQSWCLVTKTNGNHRIIRVVRDVWRSSSPAPII